jgi:RNase P/RNase MRP subunit POP5
VAAAALSSGGSGPSAAAASEPLPATRFKLAVLAAVRALFGAVGGGAAADADVLRYDESAQRAILRVHSSGVRLLWGALTLCAEHEQRACWFEVHAVTPFLSSLARSPRGKSQVFL